MQNDFCLYNFPETKFDQEEAADEELVSSSTGQIDGRVRSAQVVSGKSTSSYYYQNARDIIKLDYKIPICMEYVEQSGEVRTLAPKRFNALQLDTCGLAPWHSTYKCLQNYENSLLEESSYYNISCKSQHGFLFTSLFGLRTKCIRREDDASGQLLTPPDFKLLSGSRTSDWKEIIKVQNVNPTPSTRQKGEPKHQTLANLIESKHLDLHTPWCVCSKCTNVSHLQARNLNLLKVLVTNQAKNDLVLVYMQGNSLIIEQSNLSGNLGNRLIDSNNYINCKIDIPVDVHAHVTEIDCVLSDPESIGMDQDAYITLTLSNGVVRTFIVELKANNQLPIVKRAHDHIFEHTIQSISNSRMIPGECLTLTDHGIYLVSSEGGDKLKLAGELYPLYQTSQQAKWRSIQFGSHPRQLVYSDNTQVLTLDARVRNVRAPPMQLLSSLNSILDRDELVHKTCTVEKNLHQHVICGSKSMVLIDERYPNHALVSWKHFLKNPCLYLRNVSDGEERTSVVYSDSREIYVNQFSKFMTAGTGVMTCEHATLKLARPSELELDCVFDRCIKNRLDGPLIGLDLVSSHYHSDNSLTLFQLDNYQNVFYESFQILDETDTPSAPYERDQNEIMNKWIESFRSQVMDHDYELFEKTFDEIEAKQLVKDEPLSDSDNLCSMCLFGSTDAVNHHYQHISHCSRCRSSVIYSERILTKHFDQINAGSVQTNLERLRAIDAQAVVD